MVSCGFALADFTNCDSTIGVVGRSVPLNKSTANTAYPACFARVFAIRIDIIIQTPIFMNHYNCRNFLSYSSIGLRGIGSSAIDGYTKYPEELSKYFKSFLILSSSLLALMEDVLD